MGCTASLRTRWLTPSSTSPSIGRPRFDLIRANGNIAGYNLTGMLDHALTGRARGPSGAAGSPRPWTPWPQDGRRCAGASMWRPAVSFPGGEVELELSLANEDVLAPGRYPARVAIVGPEGWRWQRSVEVAVPSGRGAARGRGACRARRTRRSARSVPVRRLARHRGGTGSRPRHISM